MKKRKLSDLMPDLYGEIDQAETRKQKPTISIETLGVWSHEEVVWKCDRHGKAAYRWQSSVVHRSRGGGVGTVPRACPACRLDSQKLHKQVTLQQKGCTMERQALCRSEFAGGTIEEYENLPLYSRALVKWRCNQCQQVWDARLSSRLLRNNNCPKCNDRTSANEKRLRQALEDLNVPFSVNHRIGCIIQRPLSVDAFIAAGVVTDRPIAIEIDGQHHFTEPRRKERDLILNKYCLENGIHLLRIHHAVVTDYRILVTDFWDQLSGNNIYQCFVGKYLPPPPPAQP